MKVINAEMIRRALERAVDEMGDDYVYTDHLGKKAGHGADCRNWRFEHGHHGERIFMCIAGKAYEKLDIVTELVGEDGQDCKYTTALDVVHRLKGQGTVKFTDVAAMMLATAQRVQDGGSTWGAALAAAEAVKMSYDILTHNIGTEMLSA